MTAGADSLLRAAFADLPPSGTVDTHVHVVGLGAGDTGCRVNRTMRSPLHPVRRLTFSVIAASSGVRDLAAADSEYLTRLESLARAFPVRRRLRLLAFDAFCREDGTVDEERSEMFVPNDLVLRLAREKPDVFLPAVSVHPYRKDALRELERCREAGARWVKWLPNAQGMDPASPRCDAFYDRLRDLDMVLLCHTGKEQALRQTAGEEVGNPLRLRRALDRGVRVVMAHLANLGTCLDLDSPGTRMSAFDALLRVLSTPAYRGLAYADLSATTLARRLPRPLRVMLAHPEFDDRLIDGSDYPIPAVRLAVRTGALVRHGFITRDEGRALEEIRRENPLLYDFVAKRTVRDLATGRRFPASVFLPPPGLPE